MLNVSHKRLFPHILLFSVACLFLFIVTVPSVDAAASGESCGNHSDCDEGACRESEGGCFCSGLILSPTGTCEPKRGTGGACSEDAQCRTGLRCNIAPSTPGYQTCVEIPEETPASEEEEEPSTPGETEETGEAPRSRTPSDYGYLNPLGTTSVNTVINRIVRAALGVVGAIFLAMFVWGGFLWMTASGDPEKVKKAKQALINSVIGMAVVAFSFTILNILFGIAGTLVS